MNADLIIDENGTQDSIKNIIKSTINILEPEINSLNLGQSMDRILNRISSHDSYYENQLNLYNQNNNFEDIIKNNINRLKK